MAGPGSLEEAVCRALREGKRISEAAKSLGLEYWRAWSIAVKICGFKPRSRERLPEEVKAKICEMLGKGMKVTEIARELGVGAGTVSRVKAEYCGMGKKRTWKRLTAKEKIEICKRLAMCWGVEACQKLVAASMGRSEATISRVAKWCREAGLLPEKA